MALIILGASVALVATAGLVLRYRYRQGRINRLRDDVRLRVIEGQMAALRAALRIQVAEHVIRQRMRDDVFRNSTLHEEPDLWRR
jgi:hypothetical protein